jgi:tetratricopeptide (TPR) repeat protein
MRVDIIETTGALAGVRADWDAAYDRDPEAQFFLSWAWLSKWLPSIGTPWFVLAARPDGDSSAYVAFLPLWLQTKEQKSGGFHDNLVIGGNFISDYTGILCLPEHEEQAIPAFARAIKRLHWTSLRLEDLYMSCRRTDLLLQEFSGSEFDVASLNRVWDNVDLGVCPIAQLPGDWDAYLSDRLSANMRQKIRRLLRQVDGSGEFRITHADGKSIERDLDTLLGLWTVQWGQQKAGDLDEILRNMRMMLRHCFDMGSLFLPVLWQGERPVSALGTLVDARKRSFLFLTGGRDPTFAGPAPGLVLHAYSIRHAIRSGFLGYHFLRGNEPYKYSFGAEDRRIESLVVSTKDRANLGGRLDRRSLPFVLRKSMGHHRAGRRAEAECGFRQVLGLEPHDADALYGLGQIMAKKGEHAVAVGLLRRLLAVRPDIARAWFWLGRSLRATGEFAEAADAFCAGIERQPDLAGAYCDLGHLLLQLGQADLAVAALVAARGLQPEFPEIDASLARALRVRDGLSQEELARRVAANADLCDRVGKLQAIAAVADRRRQAANEATVPVMQHRGVEPALQGQGDAYSAGRMALEPGRGNSVGIRLR